MRQNFIADNIVKLRTPPASTGAYIFANAGVSDINQISEVRASTSSSFRLAVDISFDALFSFDLSFSGQTIGAEPLVVGVFTYVSNASGGGSGDFDISTLDSGVFVPLVVGDTLTCSGRCIVPKLEVPDGFTQYLVVGIVRTSQGASSSTLKAIQGRIHDEDVQVFDPLRN